MQIFKVQYLEPYFEKRVGYFKGLDAIKNNFGTSIRDLQYDLETYKGITKEEFDNNLIKYINEYSDRFKVEVLKNG